MKAILVNGTIWGLSPNRAKIIFAILFTLFFLCVILSVVMCMKIQKDYFIGNRAFYKKTAMVTLPIIVQNIITNVVSLLDNVMVGRVGTIEMSSVAIINQLLFVVNLCFFGGLAGPGIFATQYAGANDNEGLRRCFRTKIIIVLGILLCSFLTLGLFSEQLINLYIAENTSAADRANTLSFAAEYLRIMLIGLVPFAVSQIYSSSLREVGETRLPMYASTSAIFINLIVNYLLIFGKCGFPRLGVAGAAIATTLSRFTEMGIVVFFSHRRKSEFPFLSKVYRTLLVPLALWKKILKKGIPLLMNELLWSMGAASYLGCYSVRGLSVVAAANIASTVNNIFNVTMISLGVSISIMVGQHLGANENEKAKKTVWRLITLSVSLCFVLSTVLWLLSGIIPEIYNTSDYVKALASEFMVAIALTLPFAAIAHASYFTLRSGGKTLITFLFDSAFMWVIGVPLAFVLAKYTTLGVGLVYFCVLALDIIKAIIGALLIKNGSWVNNIVK